MDAWLVIIACIMAVVVLGLVFYMVILFTAEDDKNQAWFPKIVVVAGLSLACFNVLLLPYDVANKQSTSVAHSTGGGIDTVVMWQIVMICIAIFTFVLCPFAMFWYEAYDTDQENACNQMKPAIAMTSITFVIFLGLLLILWYTVGDAEIPYHAYNAGAILADAENWRAMVFTDVYSNEKLKVHVSIFVYMVGLMSAVGWVLFFIFGGVGLIAFPIDFINSFRDRPKPITAVEYAQRKADIAVESQRLIEAGQKLEQVSKNSSNRSTKKKVAAFKIQVSELEQFYEKLEISYRERGGSILKAYLSLFLGALGVILSACWIFHIILWNIAKVTTFLNALFIAMDKSFSLLGVLGYGLFSFYLLWCVVKGCTRVGMNLLIFTVYPMKINGTLMNAFLFNTMLLLISSVSVVQFCAISFREYAANTSVDSLFTTYVSRLKGLNYIVMYLQYPLLGVAFLSLLWLLLCPKRKPSEDDD